MDVEATVGESWSLGSHSRHSAHEAQLQAIAAIGIGAYLAQQVGPASVP